MSDLRIEGWGDLAKKLYDIPKTDFGRHRSNFVYRGLADETWDLKTSLIRLGPHHAKVEKPLLRSFRKYAERGSLPQQRNLWVDLTIAQHHGLPTRLLDWTVSPRVAVHFATAEEEHYDKDGVVWCVDVAAARRLLPKGLRRLLDNHDAYLFSVEMLPDIKYLADLDDLREEGEFILFFEPPALDARVVNQWAIMSVLPDASLPVSELLDRHPDLVRRYVIPKEKKWEIRDKLDQDNTTERMLFPGLDGLADWLRRYYGQGPSRKP